MLKRTTGLVLAIAACSNSTGSLDERKKEAAHQTDEMRRLGMNAEVLVGGSGSDVLIYKNVPCKADDEIIGMLFMTKEVFEDKPPIDVDLNRFKRQGFRRVECENRGRVHGTDITKPFDMNVARAACAKITEQSWRGGMGSDAGDLTVKAVDTSLVFTPPNCSQELATNLTRAVLCQGVGFTKLECVGADGSTASAPIAK